MIAPGTIGTTASRTRKPRPCSRRKACAPEAASRPKAEPPDNTMASIPSTVSAGSSKAVSRVPGPAAAHVDASRPQGRRNTMVVTPEPSLASSAWPTRTLEISVMRLRAIISPGRLAYHVRSRSGETVTWRLQANPSRRMRGPMNGEVTFLAALFAGLVSFLSPCVLPLVPPYLVYLAGTSLERFADREPKPQVKRETVSAALLFVFGFSTVFVALGASASVIGALIQAYSGPLAIFAGIAIVVMGLHFLGVTPIATPASPEAIGCCQASWLMGRLS